MVGSMRLAVEVKSATQVVSHHLKGLRDLAVEYPDVARRVVVCRESRRRVTEDGIEILPVEDFVDQLWSGELLG